MLRVGLLSGCTANLCYDRESGNDNIEDHIHQSAIPKGGAHAGKYSQIVKALTVPQCLISCCDEPKCNVMFFHKDKCMLIECNRTQPSACEPEEKHSSSFDDTFMINVRTLGKWSVNMVKTGTLGSDGGTCTVCTWNPRLEGRFLWCSDEMFCIGHNCSTCVYRVLLTMLMHKSVKKWKFQMIPTTASCSGSSVT